MELNDQIIQLVDELAMRFGIAIDWSQKNVAPYLLKLADKFITYELFTTIFDILISGGLCFLLFKCFMKAVRLWKTAYDSCSEDEEPYVICSIATGILLVIMSIIFLANVCCGIPDIVACFTFPEKILFDELKALMN